MAKHLKLQHSESVVIQSASQIYAARIANGQVAEGDEAKWMSQSIKEAIRLAVACDDAIVSDNEVDPL